MFDPYGTILGGPAQRGLDRLATTISKGTVTINPRRVIRGRTVHVGGLDQAYPGIPVGGPMNSGPQSFCNQPVVGGSAQKTTPTTPIATTQVPGTHPTDSVAIIDERHLSVGAGCPVNVPSAQFEETATTVRVETKYTATALACLRSVLVTLKSPLGHRRIVDTTTGQLVPVSASNRCRHL